MYLCEIGDFNKHGNVSQYNICMCNIYTWAMTYVKPIRKRPTATKHPNHPLCH